MRGKTTKMDAKITIKARQPEKNQTNQCLNKYRRIQTMQKKCAEIAYQCDVDVICIIYDRKYNRFREIRTRDNMTLDTVSKMMNDTKLESKQPKYQKILVGYNNDE